MTNEEIKISLDYIASMASDIKDILKYDYEISEKLTEVEYCSNIEIEVEKIIKALESQRWVPCSEKNPDETGEYLTTIKWRDRDNVCRYMVVKRDYFAEVDTWNDSLVIAWMPLPERYKESEEV